MLRKFFIFFLSFFAFIIATYGQAGQGAVKGKVKDITTGEAVPFANVAVKRNGVLVTGGTTDFDGGYYIKPLPAGTYDIEFSFLGYQTKQVAGVKVNSDKITFLDVELGEAAEILDEVEIITYKVPLINKDGGSSGGTIDAEEIKKIPGRSISSVATLVGGVFGSDDGSGNLNFRGSRSNANNVYIDGVRVRGAAALPQSAVEQVTVITGGTPAQYGDATGGIISYTTKGPSRFLGGGIEYLTSGYKIGEKTYGLDAFGYNLFEFSATGPVLWKRDSIGAKKDPLLGFFVSGNVQHTVDPSPSIIGNWRVKDETLESVVNTPLRFAPTGSGTFLNAEYLRMNDFEKVKFKQNIANRGVNWNGKLDVNTGKNTNLTFGFAGNATRADLYSYAGSLFNANRNPETTSQTYRGYVRFTQRFGSQEENDSAGIIKNAYYTVQADYTSVSNRTWDKQHQDNYFNYGYVGQFKTFQTRNYESTLTTDPVSGEVGYRQSTFVDTLIGFLPDTTINPELARYTSQYYELNGWEGYDEDGNPMYDRSLGAFALRNRVNIQQNGGLFNGDAPRTIYNLWSAPGAVNNGVSRSNTNQIGVTITGSADIKDHSISLGFNYEQLVVRSHSVSPRALWTLGNQLTNNHIQNLDSIPIIDYSRGTYPQISYNRQNPSPGEYNANRTDGSTEAQAFFDYNLRKELGLDPDGVDFVDFHSYGPETFKLNFFSADELLNQGNSYVFYQGYDAWGNKSTAAPSFDDFFNERDDFGNPTRSIDAFRPIYMAGYIQDKFAFDDLIFNIGLRVDRFDANQKVLKDPYVLFPTIKASEIEEIQNIGIVLPDDGIPQTIGDDFVVYVNDLENPTAISGYRDGDTWYNSEGSEIDDPTILRTSNGIAPLLLDRTKTSSQDITSESFEDYTPQVNFMPRIAFSFPISDEATFFAHYDVLTMRPTSNSMNPLNYFFLENANTSIIPNPNLKPEQTIDYEIGFQQALNKTSALKISAFYKEMRNQIQVVAVKEAFPRQYSTFGNIDFGTVKGLTVEYDLRRTGNVRMRANYNLQFADGTGSTTTSGANLIAAGKENLRTITPLSFDQRHTITVNVDYRYGRGKEYKGPILFDKKILEMAGINLVANARSGRPYSRQSNFTPTGFLAGSGAPLLLGQINGSRLPWQFFLDATIDKSFDIKVGNKEENKQRKLPCNIYLQVLNVLNLQNVRGVYRATGNADDDGYLTAAEFQAGIATQNDEQSFREYYSMKVNAPGNYMLPRRTRLGLVVNF